MNNRVGQPIVAAAGFQPALFAARLILMTSLAATLLLSQSQVRFDAGTVSGLPARNIGSAAMSGRIFFQAHPDDQAPWASTIMAK